MDDHAGREAQREAEAGDLDARASVLVQRVRAGAISSQALEAAAWLGDAGARHVLGAVALVGFVGPRPTDRPMPASLPEVPVQRGQGPPCAVAVSVAMASGIHGLFQRMVLAAGRHAFEDHDLECRRFMGRLERAFLAHPDDVARAYAMVDVETRNDLTSWNRCVWPEWRGAGGAQGLTEALSKVVAPYVPPKASKTRLGHDDGDTPAQPGEEDLRPRWAALALALVHGDVTALQTCATMASETADAILRDAMRAEVVPWLLGDPDPLAGRYGKVRQLAGFSVLFFGRGSEPSREALAMEQDARTWTVVDVRVEWVDVRTDAGAREATRCGASPGEVAVVERGRPVERFKHPPDSIRQVGDKLAALGHLRLARRLGERWRMPPWQTW